MKRTFNLIFMTAILLSSCKEFQSNITTTDVIEENNGYSLNENVIEPTISPTNTIVSAPTIESPPPIDMEECDATKELFNGSKLYFHLLDYDEKYVFDLCTKTFALLETEVERFSLIRSSFPENMLIAYSTSERNEEIFSYIDEEFQLVDEVTSISMEEGSPGYFTLSNDGNYLIYVLLKGAIGYDFFEIQDLYVIDLVTNETHKITDEGSVRSPRWANETQTLVFTNIDYQGIFQVYTYNVHSKEITQITNFSGNDYEIRKLIWSPDDKQILMEQTPSDQSYYPAIQKFIIIDVAGTLPSLLIAETKYEHIWWTSKNEIIAFQEGKNNPSSFLIYLVAENKWELLSNLSKGQYVEYPEYIPESRKIFFFSQLDMFYLDVDSLEVIHLEGILRHRERIRYWSILK